MELNHSKIELKKADKSFQQMKDSKTMDEYESNWRDFLNSLEKVWVKSKRECHGFKNKFQPWQGKFTKSRRIDPVAKYLKNARDADVHSIQEIVEKTAGSTTIRLADPTVTSWKVDKMVLVDGELVEYIGEQPLDQETHPAKVQAIPFTNQGVVFTVPTFHKGKQLNNPENPIELAELGLNFYSQYLDDIEKEF